MGRIVRHGIAIAVAGGCLAASRLEAQRTTITITPFVAGYLPTKALGSLDIPISGITTTVSAKLKNAPAFGGKIGITPSGRFGIEGAYFYSSTKSRISLGLGVRDSDASVQGGSLKATFRATDGKTDADVIFSAGLSGTSRSGEVFRQSLAQDQFDIGGVVGVGLHLALSPQVTFRLDGDVNLYKWNWRGSIPNTSQADVLLMAGLGLKLGR